MISNGFDQSFRLRKSSQFQSVSKNSNTFHGKVLFIVWKANGLAHCRLGITVTKKFGDSFRRNRFKRLVREGFRLSNAKGTTSVDIHVRPKNGSKGEGVVGYKKRGKNEILPSFAEVAEDFASFFEKIQKYLASS